jgi:hypothetical protein
VNPTAADRDGEIVLLDENLLNSKYDCHCGESILAQDGTDQLMAFVIMVVNILVAQEH